MVTEGGSREEYWAEAVYSGVGLIRGPNHRAMLVMGSLDRPWQGEWRGAESQIIFANRSLYPLVLHC